MANDSLLTPSESYPLDPSGSSDQNGLELNGVRRMWEGGPLRQFSETQASSHYVAYSAPFLKGYAGSYVCALCQRPSAGIYLVRKADKWLCGACKERGNRSGARQ